jgi:hypothetical protein
MEPVTVRMGSIRPIYLVRYNKIHTPISENDSLLNGCAGMSHIPQLNGINIRALSSLTSREIQIKEK